MTTPKGRSVSTGNGQGPWKRTPDPGEKARKADGIPDTGSQKRAAGVLERLCRYYLACIQSDFIEVSAWLASGPGHLDYAELDALPESVEALTDNADAIRMLGRETGHRDGGRLFLGYPTALYRPETSRQLAVEPLILLPVERSSHGPVLDPALPMLNRKPMRKLTGARRERLVSELAGIEREIGIGAPGESSPLSDLATRLRKLRPDWPWRETIDPGALSGDTSPIAGVGEPGIHNRAILIVSKGTPYTAGLEYELGQLARTPATTYRHTALHHWLTGNVDAPESASGRADRTDPPLAVMPMNAEQRQAVLSALTRPLTVITGPPGTGKSQAVSNILVNAAWQGKRILFASKNNRAVEIVEDRVNALGQRTTLARPGARRHYLRLTESLIELMSATCTRSDIEDFEELRDRHGLLCGKLGEIEAKERALIDLRNETDRLERGAENARRSLPPAMFAHPERLDAGAMRKTLGEIEARVERADRRSAPRSARLFWPAVARGRMRRLQRKLSDWASAWPTPDFPKPPAAPDNTLDRIRAYCGNMRGLLDSIDSASRYRKSLRRLQDADPLEKLARRKADLLDHVSNNSTLLWIQWLKTRPSRMGAGDRVHLGKYKSLFQMLTEAKRDGPMAGPLREKFRDILAEFGHLMPCWAITNLSARGRIPFEPGIFDIVVFDEASQCDIASALPLLSRARSAVVIGDSRQLSHISGLRHGQDQALLERFGLLSERPEWAYSYQSLFDLASARAAPEAIVSLVDHHRSHADIVEFSNREFYGGRLRVATRYDRLNRPAGDGPGILWIDVKGQTKRPLQGSALNMREAGRAMDVLRDLILREGYRGSIGFTTPFSPQAKALAKAAGEDAALRAPLDRAGFLADTVHSFQGDERDVMLFSPVLSTGCHESAKAFLRNNPNLFNVAITRARSRLIVVGDRDACIRSDIGYLSRFARYVGELERETNRAVQATEVDLGPTYPEVDRPEAVSDWERKLYAALFEAGLRPLPRHPIEKYVVDFVVSAGRRRLVIEVDGERYHRNWTDESCRRNQLRDQRLFELGYDVIRFWVYEIRDDLPNCVRRVRFWAQEAEARDVTGSRAALPDDRSFVSVPSWNPPEE